MPPGLRAFLLSGFASALVPGAATAQPLDLSDPRPRWVAVRFEMSPADRPGQLDSIYTNAFRAWLEPEAQAGRLRVTVPGEVVERYLLAGQRPVPGSFSDFVWVFDAASGHVLSAVVTGVLRQRLRLGFLSHDAEARIRIEMDTHAPAGFEPQRVLGRPLWSYCQPAAQPGCTGVLPSRYDSATGYVNAVGPITARSGPFHTRAFSPLGEARFSEQPPAPVEAVGAAGGGAR